MPNRKQNASDGFQDGIVIQLLSRGPFFHSIYRGEITRKQKKKHLILGHL